MRGEAFALIFDRVTFWTQQAEFKSDRSTRNSDDLPVSPSSPQ